MKELYTFAYLVSFAISICGCYYIMNACLLRKNLKVTGRTLFLCYFAYYAVKALIYLILPLNPTMNLILTLGGLLLIALVYKASMLQRLLSACLTGMIMIICDVCVPYLISIMAGGTVQEIFSVQSWMVVLSNFATSVLVVIVCLIFSRMFYVPEESTVELPKEYLIAATAVPGFSLLTCMLFFSSFYNGGALTAEVVISSSALILGMNIIVFYLYRQLLKEQTEKYKNMLLAQQGSFYVHELALTKQSNEHLRMLRHDLGNHLSALQHMAADGNTEMITDYLSSFQEYLDTEKEYVHTGCIALDSLLNYKLAAAKEKGADISLQIEVPSSLPMDSFDLNVLFGNLFDNAIEALDKSEKKQLFFTMLYKQGILKMQLVNSYNGIYRRGEHPQQFLTTKEHPAKHGIGLTAVGQIIQKYQGEWKTEPDDEFFTVRVLLYLSE